MRDSPLAGYLWDRIRQGVFPGARYLVARGAEVIEEGWLGQRVVKPEKLPVRADTIFDVASLTKPLVTGTLAVIFSERGMLDLEETVGHHLPELRTSWIARQTILDLLTHRSGLPGWFPLYLRAHVQDYLSQIGALEPKYPPGTRAVYSCLGYILTAAVLERVGKADLSRLARSEIFEKAGVTQTSYQPSPQLRRRIAATEEGNEREREMVGSAGRSFAGWRQGVIWGECHDLNAWTLGGVSGNAGLFSTARDLHRLSLEYLGSEERLFGPPGRMLFHKNFTRHLGEDRSIGWQLASTTGSSAGSSLSPSSIGHTGFTGTSLWIDPEAGWILILLTNRVHPRYRPDDMNAIRREFHEHALAGRGISRRS